MHTCTCTRRVTGKVHKVCGKDQSAIPTVTYMWCRYAQVQGTAHGTVFASMRTRARNLRCIAILRNGRVYWIVNCFSYHASIIIIIIVIQVASMTIISTMFDSLFFNY